MKRKYIIVIALVAILLLAIIIATCICYNNTLKKYGYQPESVADFFWQGYRWRNSDVYSDTYMAAQNIAEYPLTEDLTIRCALASNGPLGRKYSRDWLRVNSVLGPYYIETFRDAAVKYFNIMLNPDNTEERMVLNVIERPDCLILVVRSDHMFVDFYGEPVFTHAYGEDYLDQYGNAVYYQYFVVPEFRNLPDDYYLSGGPFTITIDDFRSWHKDGFLKLMG